MGKYHLPQVRHLTILSLRVRQKPANVPVNIFFPRLVLGRDGRVTDQVELQIRSHTLSCQRSFGRAPPASSNNILSRDCTILRVSHFETSPLLFLLLLDENLFLRFHWNSERRRVFVSCVLWESVQILPRFWMEA